MPNIFGRDPMGNSIFAGGDGQGTQQPDWMNSFLAMQRANQGNPIPAFDPALMRNPSYQDVPDPMMTQRPDFTAQAQTQAASGRVQDFADESGQSIPGSGLADERRRHRTLFADAEQYGGPSPGTFEQYQAGLDRDYNLRSGQSAALYGTTLDRLNREWQPSTINQADINAANANNMGLQQYIKTPGPGGVELFGGNALSPDMQAQLDAMRRGQTPGQMPTQGQRTFGRDPTGNTTYV